MYFSNKFNEFSNIKHCFFSRNGGVSKKIYSSLNCGLGSKDVKENILNNLSVVSKKIEVDKNNLFTMNQTHSNKVVIINEDNKDTKQVTADALITNIKGIAISDNDALNTDFGTAQGTAKAHSGTAYDLNVGAESSAITIAGSPAAGDQVFFQIFRDVSADNMSADALLTGVKIHFTTDAANDA